MLLRITSNSSAVRVKVFWIPFGIFSLGGGDIGNHLLCKMICMFGTCPLIYKGHTGRPREQRSHHPPTAHLAHFTVPWRCKHIRLYFWPIILHTCVWAEFVKLATILKVVHCGIVGSSNVSVACFMHSILRMMRNESIVEQIHFHPRCLR